MTAIYDCSVDSELLTGMRLARAAIGRGELVVIPTDTVYGVAADAFDPAAVARLLDAKGRERTRRRPCSSRASRRSTRSRATCPRPCASSSAEFWPGGLTVILHAQPSLQWDLGETRGTVALRMPANPIALELLAETGPLAVSSANLSGRALGHDGGGRRRRCSATRSPCTSTAERPASAYEAIGERAGDTSSTIVDATALARDGGSLRIVRAGVISRERIAAVVGEELLEPERAAEPERQRARRGRARLRRNRCRDRVCGGPSRPHPSPSLRPPTATTAADDGDAAAS